MVPGLISNSCVQGVLTLTGSWDNRNMTSHAFHMRFLIINKSTIDGLGIPILSEGSDMGLLVNCAQVPRYNLLIVPNKVQ